MKVNSPQVGFNNNIRHNGRVFHVQTEDSGVARPHIITHLFADGGRILKTTKTSYAEILDAEDLAKQVRRQMQEQHKAMLIALRAGDFDEKPRPESPAAQPPTATLSAVAPSPEAPSSEGLSPGLTSPVEWVHVGAREALGSARTEHAMGPDGTASASVGQSVGQSDRQSAGQSAGQSDVSRRELVPSETAVPSRAPSNSAPPVPLELDLGDLGPAAPTSPSSVAEAHVAPEPIESLPPPPERARRAPPGGETVYRSIVPRDAEHLVEKRPARASLPPTASVGPRGNSTMPSTRPSAPPAKYAPPRTAPALEPDRSRDDGARAAAALVDEPSLDDVIRSYLSEETPPTRSNR